MQYGTRFLLPAGLGVTILAACGGSSTGPEPAKLTLTSVTPSTGTIGTELTLFGTNFHTGATVQLDALEADSVQVVSSTTIYVLVPSTVVKDHAYAVQVSNTDGTQARLAGAFTPVGPLLRFVNGATKPSGNVGSTVIVEGKAFGDHQGTGQVLFSNGAGGTIAATIASAGDWTNTFIVTTVPAGTASGPVAVQTGLGTSDSLAFTVATNAAFSPSTITWTSTTALPVGLSGHSATFAVVGGATTTSNVVYVAGGADSARTPRSDVYYATIQPTGQLSAWTTTTSLPAAVAFHAAVVATGSNSRVKGVAGYLYILGGATDAGGTPANTIYRGAIDSTGAVTAWTTVLPTLPAAVHSAGAVIFRGDLYIAGGSRTGNAPTTAVYRSRIDSTGALGAWVAEPVLPFARAYAGFGQFGEYLYALGGDSATVTPNDSGYTNNATKVDQIAYIRINLRTGALIGPSWTVNPSLLTKAMSKHTAVVAGGNVLVTGGLYNGAASGSSEESYAQINSDGTIGSLLGATGVHTISSAGGGNLFNHAALTYVDANGAAHVLIVGGDDVNAPGTKHRQVWFY
jgi:hypothetical protein